MPIQTAPSTLTITHSDASESTLVLVDVSDNLVTYHVTELKGGTISGNYPVMTFARRPRTNNNGGPKHTIRMNHTIFDVLGQRLATLAEFVDVVRPTLYTDPSLNFSKDLTELTGEIVKSNLVKGMIEDGSFLR